MRLKEFLKPDYKKILLTITLLIIFILFYNPWFKYLFDEIGDILFLIFVFIIIYLLISLIILIYNRFEKEGNIKKIGFFKPTFWKIILTLIIFILIINSIIFLDPRSYSIEYEVACDDCPHYTVSMFSFKNFYTACLVTFIISFIEIILGYIVSCIIFWIIRKIKSEKRGF